MVHKWDDNSVAICHKVTQFDAGHPMRSHVAEFNILWHSQSHLITNSIQATFYSNEETRGPQDILFGLWSHVLHIQVYIQLFHCKMF